jgi:hypothetical protein
MEDKKYNRNTFTCNDAIQEKLNELIEYRNKKLTRLICDWIEKEYETMLKEKKKRK